MIALLDDLGTVDGDDGDDGGVVGRRARMSTEAILRFTRVTLPRIIAPTVGKVILGGIEVDEEDEEWTEMVLVVGS